MEFLASDDALDLPDRIEEVNAKRLDVQINEKTFIAVLFRKSQLILTKSKQYFFSFSKYLKDIYFDR